MERKRRRRRNRRLTHRATPRSDPSVRLHTLQLCRPTCTCERRITPTVCGSRTGDGHCEPSSSEEESRRPAAGRQVQHQAARSEEAEVRSPFHLCDALTLRGFMHFQWKSTYQTMLKKGSSSRWSSMLFPVGAIFLKKQRSNIGSHLICCLYEFYKKEGIFREKISILSMCRSHSQASSGWCLFSRLP